MNALLIFVIWGPWAIWDWRRCGIFPYLTCIYIAAMAFGVWSALNGTPGFGIPFAGGAYGLYAVTGGFFWFRHQGNPAISHITLDEVLGKSH